MAEILQFRSTSADRKDLADGDKFRPQWFAAYTYPRHEKRVAEQLESRAIEAYLPLYESTRLWNKRRVRIELPLFPGYVFVRLPVQERMRVLETPSVAYLVSSRGMPVPLSEEQVEQVRECLGRKLNFEPCEYFRPGTRVRVQSGPLSGLEGTVVRRSGRMRFVVSIDLIMRSMSVSVEAKDLQRAEDIPVIAA